MHPLLQPTFIHSFITSIICPLWCTFLSSFSHRRLSNSFALFLYCILVFSIFIYARRIGLISLIFVSIIQTLPYFFLSRLRRHPLLYTLQPYLLSSYYATSSLLLSVPSPLLPVIRSGRGRSCKPFHHLSSVLLQGTPFVLLQKVKTKTLA